jgi:hypothetical protein
LIAAAAEHISAIHSSAKQAWWLRQVVKKLESFSMPYTVTADRKSCLGPLAETANNVNEALNKARQMYEEGLANVSIKDEAGHKIVARSDNTQAPWLCIRVNS